MSTEPTAMLVTTMTESHMSSEFPIARLRHTSARRPQGSRSHVAHAPSPRATAASATAQVVELSSSAHDRVATAVTAARPETIQDGTGAPVRELFGSGSAWPWGPTL